MSSAKISVLKYFLISFAILACIVDIIYLIFVTYMSSDEIPRANKSSVSFMLIALLRITLPIFLLVGIFMSYIRLLIPVCVFYGISMIFQMFSAVENHYENKRCSQYWCSYENYHPHYCSHCQFVWTFTYLAIALSCKFLILLGFMFISNEIIHFIQLYIS